MKAIFKKKIKKQLRNKVKIKDKEKVQKHKYKWKSVDFFDREGSSPSIPIKSKKKFQIEIKTFLFIFKFHDFSSFVNTKVFEEFFKKEKQLQTEEKQKNTLTIYKRTSPTWKISNFSAKMLLTNLFKRGYLSSRQQIARFCNSFWNLSSISNLYNLSTSTWPRLKKSCLNLQAVCIRDCPMAPFLTYGMHCVAYCICIHAYRRQAKRCSCFFKSSWTKQRVKIKQ